ncbi:cytochrome P450 [Xylariaceae sp. FL0255]|nr:cytochrome P450 [Xylariaceae sp. FL0255]
MLSLTSQLVVASATGLVAHWGHFFHGEHDLQAANIAKAHAAVLLAVGYTKYQIDHHTIGNCIRQTCLLALIYASTLFMSIIIYRICYSPLRHIPGPLAMRVSKLTHVWTLTDHSIQNCKMLHGLHKKYGSVVRTGPNEVTLFGYDAFEQIRRNDSHCQRSQYYDILHPMVSLNTTRDPTIHAHRRKIWDQAFSIKALEKNERCTYEYADKLCRQLHDLVGETINISDYFEYYTFDLMGMLDLTVEFDSLKKQEHPILDLWHVAHRMLGPLNSAPWLKHLFMGIPFIERLKYYKQFMGWAHDELARNIKNNQEERTDLIGYVINDAVKHGGIKKNWNFILGDFVLAIAAGSDPVRQVMTNLIYYLIQYPSQLAQVRQELNSIDIRDYRALQSLPHLTACIYETLRLNPAVPSAGLRIPPKGGITINGVFIPEYTTMVTPQYSLHRDETCFVKPNEWIPERFTTRPELTLNKNAFVAWSIGKMNCLGKNLSLLEIRVGTALFITQFDFKLAPNDDGQKMFTAATDFFTTTPGPLNLVLSSR